MYVLIIMLHQLKLQESLLQVSMLKVALKKRACGQIHDLI